MKKTAGKKLSGMVAAAVLGAAIVSPGQAAMAAAAFSDMNQAGSYRPAVQKLVEMKVLSGYASRLLKPDQAITRAELAKLVVLGLGLRGEGSVSLSDVTRKDWFYRYASDAVALGIMATDRSAFHPAEPVTQEALVAVLAKATKTDAATVTKWFNKPVSAQVATRAEAAFLVYVAQQQVQSSAAVEVTSVKALNPITLEVKFSAPLSKEEVDLEKAKANFQFSGGLTIRNIPQLKTGATSTYIVPTTPQAAGTTYTFSYKGKQSGTFQANENKLTLRSAQQVSYDTFELESSLADGVTDYGNIVAAYSGKRNGLDFILDENNQYNGKSYQIISSMRGAEVTITPEGGTPIKATYVPFTQNTDGRQAPKFRLPNGQSLKPGTVYTVTSDWATIKQPTFTAGQVAPLVIETVTAIDNKTIQVTLAADPKDELFAFRRVTLSAPDGSKLTAQYKVTTRKGATGTFELLDNAVLAPATVYTVEPVGAWATAEGVKLTVK